MIKVTQTYLPEIAEYNKYLKGIWERNHLTNHGPLVLELEAKLKERFNVKHFFFVNNGTIALQIALKALEITGKVITTPFSYVATTSSILWEGLEAEFADIDDSMCINPKKVEELAKNGARAILATHVYGNPCDVVALEQISKKFQIPIIYDAAHAFDLKYKDNSILNYGDISTLSFHATKLFHTIEGGAIVTNNDELAHKIAYMRNFGHKTPETFWGVGINGKASEFNAAMGLCMLNHIPHIISERKKIIEQYLNAFQNTTIKSLSIRQNTTYNYAYFPVVFPNEQQLEKIVAALQAHDIFPRRYFFPALNTLDFVNYIACPTAESVAKRVLCLPLYVGLKEWEVAEICKIVKANL